MIRMEAVQFGYRADQPIFEQWNWSAARGEAWAVLGPSGCGKSTLLTLLAGLQHPSSGQITMDGIPLVRPRPQTGVILQEYGLLPWQTVRQNIELGLKIRRFYGPDGKHAPEGSIPAENISAWLDRLGLRAVEKRYPAQISGGQRQRTAIARTLLLQPDLLLMDEPFSSLDAPTREGLQRLTLELWQENHLTLILVTHSIEEAAVLGQKILLLGKAPQRTPLILDNPGAANPGYCETGAYLDCCRDLRARLGEA